MRERLAWIESRGAPSRLRESPWTRSSTELEMNSTPRSLASFLLFVAALLFFFVALRPVLVGSDVVPTLTVLAIALFAIGLAVSRLRAR